ncbi:MAG TPA: hypothetical protein VFA18_02070, partial [Gemmataceae bacterium]|nr:hypothetical protein [Gemmataceae bacterium]
MDAPKLDKGKETPERVPAPPVPARPSLLRRSAAVPWWLLRGLAKMNHETKAGLVVSASFLCLVGVVLYSKMKEQEQPDVPTEYQEIVHADANGELQAELPADPTPSGTAGKSTVTDNDLRHLRVPPGTGPAPVVIQTSATGPGVGDTNGSNSGGYKSVSTPPLPHSGKPARAGGLSTNTVVPNTVQDQHSTDLSGLDDPTKFFDMQVNNGQNHAPGTESGHGLGTSKTPPPTRVIPGNSSKTQPNTFHLGGHSDNSQNQNTHAAAQPVSQANPGATKSVAGNSAQTDATQHLQHGLGAGATTTSQIKPNAKATEKDHGTSLADHSTTGSSPTDAFGHNTGGIFSGGMGSPASVTNPLDFHTARPLPTGSPNNASGGSAASIHDKGTTKTGLTENSQANPSKTDLFAKPLP